MKLALSTILGLGWLANAAVIPSRDINASVDLEARDSATGYRSVAYFVNWVGSLPTDPFDIPHAHVDKYLALGYLWKKLQSAGSSRGETDAHTICVCQRALRHRRGLSLG